jgi:hypothetical protein
MNIVHLVTFGEAGTAAIYLNQRFHTVIDDVRDVEQILESTKILGRFEYMMEENHMLELLYLEKKNFPQSLREALDFSVSLNQETKEKSA